MTDYIHEVHFTKGIIYWGSWGRVVATDDLSLPGVYFKKPKGLLECVPTRNSLHYILQRKIMLSVLGY